MRSKSTKLMKDIVDYIDLRFPEDNKVPTMQEIADHFGVTKGSISQYIQVMVERGLIEKENGARGLVTPNMKKLHLVINNSHLIGDTLIEEMVSNENIKNGDFVLVQIKNINLEKNIIQGEAVNIVKKIDD